ncbi:MAG: BCCT family transporter [Elusimicrobiales bacterium]|nr:BCCT family transporter [Elusimicrobiales bacterium]
MKRFSTTFVRSVAVPGIIVLLLLSAFCGIFPTQTAHILQTVQEFFYAKLSWLYIFLVSFFFLFLVVLAFGKTGNIRLGADNTNPQHSFIAWVAMLFSAGMGIGLMYFGVAEPLSHYVNPPLASMGHSEKEALFSTFIHWGIHAWSIYAVMGLVLAYFSYRYRLPLAMRSGFYPMLKNRINGRIGDIIDVFALCCTFFGITTSLGFGVLQLNSGLAYLGILPDGSFAWQTVIVCMVITVAVFSACSGVNRGVKILSEINMMLAVMLMLFVLSFGPTVHILEAFSEAIGYYFSNLIPRTFTTFAFNPEGKAWLSAWTIMYWAWWISWAPFVGLFIAKISKGRTVREFILVVLFVPSIFIFLWMSVFGGGAIWLDVHKAAGALSAMAGDPDSLLFNFLQLFPFTKALCILAITMIAVFFVTSADSGIMVLNSIASKNKGKTPVWQNIFWGAVMALLSLLLLRSGGLKALQTMTLVSALPFGLIMLFFCFCLWKALKLDIIYHQSSLPYGSHIWDSSRWQDYLNQILRFTKKSDVREFIALNVRPAFKELCAAFAEKGVNAEIREGKTGEIDIYLLIRYDKLQNFKYGVRAEKQEVSQYIIDEDNAPTPESDVYVPMSYYNSGRTGNDIQHLEKEEIIADVLREYERFIAIAADERSEIWMLDKEE